MILQNRSPGRVLFADYCGLHERGSPPELLVEIPVGFSGNSRAAWW